MTVFSAKENYALTLCSQKNRRPVPRKMQSDSTAMQEPGSMGLLNLQISRRTASAYNLEGRGTPELPARRGNCSSQSGAQCLISPVAGTGGNDVHPENDRCATVAGKEAQGCINF